jgi:hypothetical protein
MFFFKSRAARNSVLPQTEPIEVEVMSPVNQAAETWLEWLHAQVSPKPGGQAAENLFALVQIDKRVCETRWRGDSGPVEERTCRVDRPGILPLVLRSQMDTIVMGTPVRAGRCYITEVNFHVHHVAAVQVKTGIHKLCVIIRNKENTETVKEFKLTVPPRLSEPIRLEPA